ncbi:MAG: flavodoxin domain-containing protein [Chitinophagaceae bacterium]|nr:flavodoxin domain-containing protein [Chitinophagaceae bacterium]
MLAASKLKIIQDLIASSSIEELIWINGYLSGVLAGTAEQSEQPVPSKAAVSKITIAYGTETGNSKKLATNFAATAKKSGINAKLVSLDQYRLNDLAKEEYFFTIISTQGDGEPPAAAKKFYEHIHQNGFKVNQLKFGVLALGDTSYPLFCKAGEDVDAQLQKLGGERVVSLHKCDTDYESDAGSWFSQVITKLSGNGAVATPTAIPAVAKKSGKKVYAGSILKNINLNDRGSNKQTHHIEIAAEEIAYSPGDSIGIVPKNPAYIVDAIISLTGIDKNKELTFRNESVSILNLLQSKLNIVYLPERVVKQYASIVQQEIPETKIGLLDLLKIYSVKNTSQFEEVIGILEPITPRLYSIASSKEAHGEEVHLTVARDFFQVNNETKLGLASDYLSQLPDNAELEFYVHKNDLFRLPAPDKDVIMIGPGTGVAPFRSFLAERDSTGAGGRNWLFFGDQHFTTDFLYQSEMQNWLDTGVLSKLTVAFSRDQQEKVYVQHKMLRQAAEFYDWLENGAHIYVCGAKEPMSVDVENTLLEIVQQAGNKSAEEANEYLNALKVEGRYMRDVY